MQFLHCGRGKIRISRGDTGRCKFLEIIGVTEEEIRRRVGCCQKGV
ncbi:MAG: hypothetical protein WBI44_02960 [Syntrophaceticus sp.]